MFDIVSDDREVTTTAMFVLKIVAEQTREYPVSKIPLVFCQTEWDKEGFFL